MNYITHLKKLELEQKNYIDFLSFCCVDHFLKIKLAYEIVRLSEKIAIINRMTIQDLKKEVIIYQETKQSKMNFKTIKKND